MGVETLSLSLPFLLILLASGYGAVGLQVGFYKVTCPCAERIVRVTVQDFFQNNSGIAPGLIRLHFHDCFVRGCDGSVLIDGNDAEKAAPPNMGSLRGFEVIDAAKALLEKVCPETVSCADILAFAARDSAFLAGKINYEVPAGRRDGLVSIKDEATDNLPPPTFDINQLVASFAAKNLTERDMVTLSGAHSIGVSHCSSFLDRIYNTSSPTGFDPTLNSTLVPFLRALCPPDPSPRDPNVVVNMTANFTVLDNHYYLSLTNNLGLFTSDHALITNTTSRQTVLKFQNNGAKWKKQFAKAMVKMGKIENLTAPGEIRLNCRLINPPKIELLLEPKVEYSEVTAAI